MMAGDFINMGYCIAQFLKPLVHLRPGPWPLISFPTGQEWRLWPRYYARSYNKHYVKYLYGTLSLVHSHTPSGVLILWRPR